MICYNIFFVVVHYDASYHQIIERNQINNYLSIHVFFHTQGLLPYWLSMRILFLFLSSKSSDKRDFLKIILGMKERVAKKKERKDA